MARHSLKLFTLLAAFLALVACGGGTQVAGGGIGGTGISQGPITGFGSIFVNGVEFDTSKATIVKDGTPIGPLSTADLMKYLKVGMIVTVDGNITSHTSGIAATVTYARELEGPIAAKTSDTLTVLGQTVIVDNLTKIEVAEGVVGSLADLSIGNVVEVSGFNTANGIRATYIEAKQSGSKQEYELKGVIKAIDAANPTLLTIGAQIVDINGAVFNFTPKVNDYVEVYGTIPTPGGNFIASSLELKSRTLETTNADRAELQGYVTSTTSAAEFVLNATPVETNAQTLFNGGSAIDIKPGVILEVEGALVNGTLIATKISFEDALELEGNVDTIDTTTDILTLSSYPTIGISFNDVLTELEGISSFSALAAGDHIKVRGRVLDAASCGLTQCVLATQLSFESSSSGGTSTSGDSSGGSGSGSSSGSGSGGSTTSSSTELQGPVDSIVPGKSFTVLGVTVSTASITSFSGDNITDSTSFFANLEVGDLVDVTGTQVGNTITWDSVDVEN